jgi:hypothetical protein
LVTTAVYQDVRAFSTAAIRNLPLQLLLVAERSLGALAETLVADLTMNPTGCCLGQV